MTQTLKNLINTVAAEVYELQDTKADRVELGADVRTVAPDVVVIDSSGNTVPPLIRLVKTGNVLSINTEKPQGGTGPNHQRRHYLRGPPKLHQQRSHRQR